jgi:UDP-N-acetylglucosamine--N-acetylmuramyl-(pentapeptide) pyrophosphoryl-undecaprenol N-acetylglucosamine transferase
MAIAELCVVAKPSILVPYPFAAEDHQTANARNLEQKHAGIMIKDEEAKNRLVNEAINLVKDERRRTELSKNISVLGVRDADEVIAREIVRSIN